jgi:hypothetical protein
MRWEYKPKTKFDKIKKRFALFPVVINEEWVWLETYYSYTEEGYAGPDTIRFNTDREAAEWLQKYR